MDDHLQVRAALSSSNTSPPQTPIEPSVSFNTATDSITVQFKSTDDMQSEEAGDAVESSDDFTAALMPDNAGSDQCCFSRFFGSYRSTNPESRVTPFAIVLLAVLFLIYVLNQADRLVLAVLIPAGLRCDPSSDNNDSADCFSTDDNYTINVSNFTDCVSFNNAEQGLLTGPAFTIIYVIAGLPLARLADTASRSLVLLIGLAFWSAMMVLSGSVAFFWELLLLRVFLGVGEVRPALKPPDDEA